MTLKYKITKEIVNRHKRFSKDVYEIIYSVMMKKCKTYNYFIVKKGKK